MNKLDIVYRMMAEQRQKNAAEDLLSKQKRAEQISLWKARLNVASSFDGARLKAIAAGLRELSAKTKSERMSFDHACDMFTGRAVQAFEAGAFSAVEWMNVAEDFKTNPDFGYLVALVEAHEIEAGRAKRLRRRPWWEFQEGAELVADLLEREALRAPPSRKRRRSNPRPVTPAQAEAVHIVGAFDGDISKAARKLGKDRKTVEQLYKAGLRNVGLSASSLRIKPGKQNLPHDKRGNVTIEDRADD